MQDDFKTMAMHVAALVACRVPWSSTRCTPVSCSGPVHGLQVEVFKRHVGELLGVATGLRIDPFDLLPRMHNQPGVPLGADAQPVNAFGWRDGAIGLHGNFEAARVQRMDQSGIQLQKGLTPGFDHKTVRSSAHTMCSLKKTAAHCSKKEEYP